MMCDLGKRQWLRTGLLVCCLLAGVARAGVQQVPCERPFVFEGAAANVVVLPFTRPGQQTDTSEGLSRLIQRETLRSIAKFGSVGSVQLSHVGDQPCEAAMVRAQLLGAAPGARTQVDKGRALVLVWGRIVEAGDQLYLQTFVEFLRRGVRERIALPLGSASLTGQLSTQGFAGPQRRIERAQLEEFDRFARRTAALYESPDENSRRIEIPPDVPFSYYVTEIRGDWMYITAFTADQSPGKGKQSGGAFSGRHWMKAVAAERDWTLRKAIPELAFVEAAVGFLVLRDTIDRQVSSPNLPNAAVITSATRRALDEYRENIAASSLQAERELFERRYAAAHAVTQEMQGLLALLPREVGVDAVRQARQRFRAGSELQPANADVRNLALMTDLWLASRTPSAAATQPLVIVDALRTTLGLAPDNRLVQANLRTALRWLLEAPRPAGSGSLATSDQLRLEKTLAVLDEFAR